MTGGMTAQGRTRGYYIAIALILFGLLCGHVVSVVSSITLFHLLVGLAVILSFIVSPPLPRFYYGVALYFLLYTVWTLSATLLWAPPLEAKEAVKFAFIPLLVLSVLRLMLKEPRTMLRVFFYVALAYILSMVVLGYVEHFTGFHLPTSVSHGADGEERFLSTGLNYNPNDYSVILIMAALYLLAYSNHFRQRCDAWITAFAIVLVIPPLLWNDCRTGLTVLVLAMLFPLLRRIPRKVWIPMLILLLLASATFAVLNWHLIATRMQLYIAAFASLYDSYGLGFGLGGDEYYLALLNNYDLTRGLTNAHSYLLQLPLTSGLPVLLAFCAMITLVMHHSSKLGRDLFWLMPLLYLLLLFSPSSSLYLWAHYLFLCIYICYAVYAHSATTQPTPSTTPSAL